MRAKRLSVLSAFVALTLMIPLTAVAKHRTSAASVFLTRTTERVISEDFHAPNPGCPVPILKAVIEGTGFGFRMGKVTVERSHLVNVCSDTPIHDGEWKITTASGEVWGMYEGTLEWTDFDSSGNPTHGKIKSSFTIEGGSGRFEGASGNGQDMGRLDKTTGIANMVSFGLIQTDR